jgi:hypothetical protein
MLSAVGCDNVVTLDSGNGGRDTAGVSSLKTWEKRPSLTTGRVSTLFTSPWALCQISERELPLAGRGGPANVQGSHPQGPGIGAMKWWRSVSQAGPKQWLGGTGNTAELSTRMFGWGYPPGRSRCVENRAQELDRVIAFNVDYYRTPVPRRAIVPICS